MRSALLVCLVIYGCSSRPAQPPAPDPARIGRQFEAANRMLVQKENDEMDVYAHMHRIPFVATPGGIRYFVYAPSAAGDSISDGSTVKMSYTVSLLDGTVCYTSDTSGPRTIQVGHEDAESGLHRGLQRLKRGDKALIMMPSYLAHGLLGDLRKIPPQSPILYNVAVY